MPPDHTAQTSTEAKKAYKKNGPVISERTHKQLQRGHELEQRAAREREAEKRRRSAKEKREERERKENAARQQLGVGLATQLIGFSHTQAHLKNGMEAFLGVNKKKQDEERRRKEEEIGREEELAKKLEVIVRDIEKDPFNDDDDMDSVMLDLPDASMQDGSSWVDDELDDDILLEAHDSVISEAAEDFLSESIFVQPHLTTSPFTAHKQPSFKGQQLPATARDLVRATTNQEDVEFTHRVDAKEDVEFTRTHGPINRVVESALCKLPGPVIELLSQDVVSVASDWAPAHGLLYKLNPIGMPPHRLRLKVGCVAVCLMDLNTSSPLSKGQHVRIVRIENERLECLTLDGQLARTKIVITRVPLPARYRNDHRFPFTRTQYPIRVAADFVSKDDSREGMLCGFKLQVIKGNMQPPPTLIKRPVAASSSKSKAQVSLSPTSELPGLPASKESPATRPKPPAPFQPVTRIASALDGWDDFLQSGTQIARELSAEPAPQRLPSTVRLPSPAKRPASPKIVSIFPLSTQDLDFSLDDLEDAPQLEPQCLRETKAGKTPGPLAPSESPSLLIMNLDAANKNSRTPPSVPRGPLSRTAYIRRINPDPETVPPPIRLQKPTQPRMKRSMAPPSKPVVSAKKPCLPLARLRPPVASTKTTATTIPTTPRELSDFGMSTQEAGSFFDDDDDLAFGSPPIAVKT